MTLNDLMTGSAAPKEQLETAGEEVWRVLRQETRDRVLSPASDSPAGRAVQEAFDAMVKTAVQQPEAGVKAEALGQWSRTYSETHGRRETLRSVLRAYLGESGLLYRGWDR